MAAKDQEAGSDLYPVAVLIDELKHVNSDVRLNAMKSVKTIAVALGPERTRLELVPFLRDSVDDEDSILLVLAEELGSFVPLVGGGEHAFHLLSPLESLATMEDPQVRAKAVASLCTVASAMPDGHHQEHFVPLLRQLATNDWFTSRIAASHLFAASYSHVDEPARAEYIGLFSALCRDDTPMVRRAAAQALSDFVAVVQVPVVEEHFVPLFATLSQDDQDSVKLLSADNCVAVAKMLPADACNQSVLPVVLRLAADNSYRVRWSVASQLVRLAEALGGSQLVPICIKLLEDPEAEARGIAAGNIEGFAALVPVEVLVSQLLPRLQVLANDDESHVRASLASSIMGLSSRLGRELTIEHLLPMFLKLLKDDEADVRLSIISKLDSVNQVFGIAQLSQALLPAIVGLAEDSKWRVRLAIIRYIPLLGSQLGVEYFNEKLSALCMTWLGDKIHSIREAAVANLADLTKTFGQEWSREQIVPKIVALYSHSNYLFRLTALGSAHALSEHLDVETFASSLLPVLLNGAQDPVPNIRLKAAKVLGIVGLKAGPESYRGMVRPVLESMSQDSDMDVKFFAEEAIQKLDG